MPQPYIPQSNNYNGYDQAPPAMNPNYNPSQTDMMQTLRVNIPPGMMPGQQISIPIDPSKGAASETAIVTIPDRSKWVSQNPAQFDAQVPKPQQHRNQTPAPSYPSQQQHSSPNLNSNLQTLRVNIPLGMTPGQQISIPIDPSNGAASETAVVTIPDRSKWVSQNPPQFDAQVPKPQQHHNKTSAPSYPSQQQRPSPNLDSNIQTLRVNIPAGMNTGQQISIPIDPSKGAASETAVVTIPDRSKWVSQNPPQFDAQVPKPQQSNNMVIQGSFVPTNNGNNYQQQPPTTRPQGVAWVSYERYSGKPYNPPRLGMEHVSPNEICRAPSSMSNVPASGRRRALLIGINYPGTRSALRGCVNDANNMKRLLTQHGFPDDSCHMVCLVDENPRDRNYLPTKANIMRAMQWLVQGVSQGDVLFFHYSGHGAQVPDKEGLEADGYNETICPSDFQKKGQIVDDVLWSELVFSLPSGVRLTSVMDCCHSGTGLDLPFEYDLRKGKWVEDINPAHAKGDVILFSGCEDSQTSADAYDNRTKQGGGAMTQSFMKAYEENPMATYPDFMAAIHKNLRRRGFKQRPQLTTSQRFDFNQRIFSFIDGIEPNRNEAVGRMKRRHVRPARGGFQKSDFGTLIGGMALGALFF